MKVLYDELLIKFGDSNPNLIIKETNLPVNKGRIKGNKIAIRRNLSMKEKGCILAEELGHYYTTVGNILDQSNEENRKQEQKARLWAYDELIGLDGIIRAYQNGCQNLHEMAEFLDVAEEFLSDALISYQGKYGTKAKVGKYEVSFVPILKVRKI